MAKSFEDYRNELLAEAYPPGSKVSAVDLIGIELLAEERMEKDHAETSKK